jgi:5-methylcytosine-specific restriction endonuclease McrA
LEQAGSNDDSNLQPLCNECHEAKTSTEAAYRAA